MESSTGWLLKLFVQFLLKVMLMCMQFGVSNIFARPWTLKLFWNVSLFKRNSWLLGLPTTFMFVEEDLNKSLQEASVSCHDLSWETGLAHWDPTVSFWASLHQTKSITSASSGNTAVLSLPSVTSHLVSQQNVRRLTRQSHLGSHCVGSLLSLGDWEKISYSWHEEMGNLSNMIPLLRRFGRERQWGSRWASPVY